MTTLLVLPVGSATSQSAFVRGFIDDARLGASLRGRLESQSAFVRGFIDDKEEREMKRAKGEVSIRVRARLHR